MIRMLEPAAVSHAEQGRGHFPGLGVELGVCLHGFGSAMGGKRSGETA